MVSPSALVFMSMIFGFFGLVYFQHIEVYNKAYEFWVDNAVYARKDSALRDPEKCNSTFSVNDQYKIGVCDKEICSKAESYSRQICRINDILISSIFAYNLVFIFSMITSFLDISMFLQYNSIFGSNSTNMDQYSNFYDGITYFILTSILLCVMYYLVKNPMNENDKAFSGNIDDKLFQVWLNHRCHKHKNQHFKKNRQPRRLYKTLAEEIFSGGIENPNEYEKELVRNLVDDPKKPKRR